MVVLLKTKSCDHIFELPVTTRTNLTAFAS